MQNGIEKIMKDNPLIPVVTINAIDKVSSIAEHLASQNVYCIEITLRTPIAWDAIRKFKEDHGEQFSVGVGTILNEADVQNAIDHKVDFIVSPGCSSKLVKALDNSGIPFLPGVATPSEIIQAMSYGWKYFKFFPANLYGGLKALKTFGQLFSEVKFCPTGGISKENHKDYLALENVLCVGGSWLSK